MALKFWKKKQPQPQLKKKSFEGPRSSFVGFLQANDNWNLSFAMLMQYYERCAPFGSAVNEIADAASDIEPRVWDKRKKAYVDNHPLLELLEHPNPDMGRDDFVCHAMSILLITGNPLIDIVGSVTGKPLSMDIVTPDIVRIEPNKAGDVGTITVNSEFGARQYTENMVKGRTVYTQGSDREIVHIKRFNPKRGSRQFFASPIARPLYYDIEQYIQGGLHNKSLLEKGARPSGVLTTKNDEPMDDDTFQRLQEQLKEFLQGAGAAGEVMIGENADFRELSVHNKDMDYKTLITNATNAIYRQFKIPLPLVSSEAMTYSNYGTSQISLYDRAVLPNVQFLFNKIGQSLFPRYSTDYKDLVLTFDDKDIPALATRRIENTKTMSQIGAFEINELRDEVGFEPLEGGDVLFRPSSDIPALDGYSDDNTDDETGERNVE